MLWYDSLQIIELKLRLLLVQSLQFYFPLVFRLILCSRESILFSLNSLTLTLSLEQLATFSIRSLPPILGVLILLILLGLLSDLLEVRLLWEPWVAQVFPLLLLLDFYLLA